MMLKKCLSLFITGIIFCAIGGIGIATLAINGINLNGISIGPSFSESQFVNAEMFTMPIEETQEITTLDFSADAGVFKVVRGESFTVETNLSTIGWEISDNCLKIENTASMPFMNFNDVSAVITVTIPERQFNEVKLELNAGEFYADDIIADKLIIKMDAGEAVFNNVSAISDSDITINAGECIFQSSVLNNSEINMDAGEMIFEKCELTGENDINLDFGEISMTLLGKRSDYKFEIENDLGAVNIDENSDNDESINPIGTINVNLDLGECNIEFTEE